MSDKAYAEKLLNDIEIGLEVEDKQVTRLIESAHPLGVALFESGVIKGKSCPVTAAVLLMLRDYVKQKAFINRLPDEAN